MGEATKIEWCDHTFNHWRGCTKVSPGCLHCYAERMSRRNPKVLGVWGAGGTRVIASEAKWREPLKWDRRAAAGGVRRRVFCASIADWLEDRPELDEPLARLFQTIRMTPHLDWLLLTKRPEDWARRLIAARQIAADSYHPCAGAWGWIVGWLEREAIPPNVWLGVSVEDQARADGRIPRLLEIPAAVRFLSCEPLLGPLNLDCITLAGRLPGRNVLTGEHRFSGLSTVRVEGGHPRLDWVIVGGESGPGARPMHPKWARSIRDQCRTAGVPFFFKQWGEWKPGRSEWSTGEPMQDARWIEPDGSFSAWGKPQAGTPYWVSDDAKVDICRPIGPAGVHMTRVGKVASGRLLDGREWSEFPEPKGVAR